jgi:hypothetical protein
MMVIVNRICTLQILKKLIPPYYVNKRGIKHYALFAILILKLIYLVFVQMNTYHSIPPNFHSYP